MDLLKSWLVGRYDAPLHRQIIIFAGEAAWSQEKCLIVEESSEGKKRWLGDSKFFSDRGLPERQASKLLGTECDIAFYDGTRGISPRALFMLAGTINRSGLLVICLPPIKDWSPIQACKNKHWLSHGHGIPESSFAKHWIERINQDKSISLIEQNEKAILAPYHHLPSPVHHAISPLSKEQDLIYNDILDNAEPVNALISARRGRGKSYLLGKIAKKCLKLKKTVAVCSLHKYGSLKALAVANHSVSWYAPDNPKLQEAYDLLIIDEVASLPIPLITSLIENKKNYILASTIDGYEGTGRGIEIKLIPYLKERYSAFEHYTLEQPLRYHKEDCIEKHLDQVFMLSHKMPPKINSKQCLQGAPRVITQKGLYQHEDLHSIISILRIAHYQTNVDDIVRMLDMPDVLCFYWSVNNEPVAAALIYQEGGQALSDVAEGIASGQRRVKGHLTAQSMAMMLSDESLATRSYWRIHRIAVSPEYRRLGIGSNLLKYIEQQALQNRVETLSTSFARSLINESFWQTHQYTLVRIGKSRDASSGENSLLMIKDIAKRHGIALEEISQIAQMDSLTGSEPHNIATINIQIQTVFKKRILDYVNQTRSLLHLGASMAWWLNCNNEKVGKHKSAELLKDKWIKGLSEENLCKKHKINGRKQLYKKLHEAHSYLYWE